MRTADNEKRDGLTGKKTVPAQGGGRARRFRWRGYARWRKGTHEPERTCCLSGKKAPRENLIRLAIGPDGTVAPDIRAKVPGRGAWIGVDRKTLEEAISKGRLAKALNRAFKTAVNVPNDLADQ